MLWVPFPLTHRPWLRHLLSCVFSTINFSHSSHCVIPVGIAACLPIKFLLKTPTLDLTSSPAVIVPFFFSTSQHHFFSRLCLFALFLFFQLIFSPGCNVNWLLSSPLKVLVIKVTKNHFFPFSSFNILFFERCFLGFWDAEFLNILSKSVPTGDSSSSSTRPKVALFHVGVSFVLCQHFSPDGLCQSHHWNSISITCWRISKCISIPDSSAKSCLLNICLGYSTFQTKHVRRAPDICPLLQICFSWLYSESKVFTISASVISLSSQKKIEPPLILSLLLLAHTQFIDSFCWFYLQNISKFNSPS